MIKNLKSAMIPLALAWLLIFMPGCKPNEKTTSNTTDHSAQATVATTDSTAESDIKNTDQIAIKFWNGFTASDGDILRGIFDRNIKSV